MKLLDLTQAEKELDELESNMVFSLDKSDVWCCGDCLANTRGNLITVTIGGLSGCDSIGPNPYTYDRSIWNGIYNSLSFGAPDQNNPCICTAGCSVGWACGYENLGLIVEWRPAASIGPSGLTIRIEEYMVGPLVSWSYGPVTCAAFQSGVTLTGSLGTCSASLWLDLGGMF